MKHDQNSTKTERSNGSGNNHKGQEEKKEKGKGSDKGQDLPSREKDRPYVGDNPEETREPSPDM